MIHSLLWSVFIINFLSLVLAFSPGFAQDSPQLQAQAYVLTPWSKVQKLVIEKLARPMELDRAVPALQAQFAGEAWTLKNLQFRAISLGLKVQPLSENLFRVSGTWDVSFAVGSMQTSGTKVIGALTVSYSLGCTEVSARNQSVSMSFDLNLAGDSTQGTFNRLPVRSQESLILWPPGSWWLQKPQCQGPRGLSEVVQGNLENYFRNPEAFQNMIGQYLNEQIQHSLAQIDLSQKFPTPFGELEVLDHYIFPGKGVYSSALWRTAAPHGIDMSYSFPHLDQAPEMRTKQSLLVPRIAIVKSLEELIKKNLSSQVYDFRQSHDFQKILNSRTKQLFAWPDLRKIDRSGAFPVVCKSVRVFGLSGGTSEVRFLWRLGCQLYVQRAGSSLPYLDFTMEVESILTSRPENTGWSLASRLRSFQQEMNPQYVKRFRPNDRYPRSSLEKGIRSQVGLSFGQLSQEFSGRKELESFGGLLLMTSPDLGIFLVR